MSTILTIKLVAILIGILSAGGGILYLQNRLKKGDKAISKNKTLKRQKNSTVKIQRERNRNEKQKDELNDEIDNADPDKLSDSYRDGLQDLPD